MLMSQRGQVASGLSACITPIIECGAPLRSATALREANIQHCLSVYDSIDNYAPITVHSYVVLVASLSV